MTHGATKSAALVGRVLPMMICSLGMTLLGILAGCGLVVVLSYEILNEPPKGAHPGNPKFWAETWAGEDAPAQPVEWDCGFPRCRRSKASVSISAHWKEAIMNSSAASELQGISRFTFQEGQLEEFKRLSAQIIEITRSKDNGTLQLEVYFNDDESECIVLERYRDSGAFVEHATHLGGLGEVIPTMGFVSGQLLGEPSAELRAMIAGSDVRVFTPFLSL
jgi:hypothetical protein